MAKKSTDEEEEQEEPKEDLSGDGTVAVNDAWTGMLAISLLALGGATGLLAWDYLKYEGDVPKTSLIGSTPKAPVVAAPQDKKDGAPVVKDKDKDKDKDEKKL